MPRFALIRLTMILGALTAFAPMSIDMYLPALPELAREFHATPGTIALTLSAFFVALAFGQALYGPLTDRLSAARPRSMPA